MAGKAGRVPRKRSLPSSGPSPGCRPEEAILDTGIYIFSKIIRNNLSVWNMGNV